MALCQQTKTSSQNLEAMEWYFGDRQCRSILFVDDVAGSVAGENWEVNVMDGEVLDANKDYVEKKYLFWLDNGVVAAPTPAADQTLFPITYTNGDDAATIAGLMIAAVQGDAALTKLLRVALADNSLVSVEYQNKFVGAVTTEVIANAPSETIAVEKVGYGGNLGSVATGGSTITTELSTLEIKDDQNGENLLDELITGITVTTAMTLAEMTTQRWKDLIGNVTGGVVTSGSDEIVGYGSAKLYSSLFDLGGILAGHPIRLPSTDRSGDISCLTAPKMTTINFSGTEVQGAEMEFKAYQDSRVDSKVNIWRRGDYTLL